MFNYQNIMFNDPLMATVNIVLIVGIVLALLAAPKIKKGTRELHSKNLASRRKVYGHNEG